MTSDQIIAPLIVFGGLAAFVILPVFVLPTIRQRQDRRADAPVDYDRLFRAHRPDYRGYCSGCINAGHGRVPHRECPEMRLGSHSDAAKLRGDWERALGGGRRG